MAMLIVSLHSIVFISIGSYVVQQCEATADVANIDVQCSYAFGSTASAKGIVFLQNVNSSSSTNRNGTLNRPVGSLIGRFSFRCVENGEYRVSVYDEQEDYIHNNPAIVIAGLVTVSYYNNHQLENTTSILPTTSSSG